MKLFGLFGKSSNDDKDTTTEESAPPISAEEQMAPEPPEDSSSQSQQSVDRGATMSDVIKAVTDQFALINADSDADLRAVGAALCQIPGVFVGGLCLFSPRGVARHSHDR